MTWHNKLKIRGISGWDEAQKEPAKGSVTNEVLAEEASQWDNRELKPTDPGWRAAPEAIPVGSTPASRLAQLQKDLKEGKAELVLATDLPGATGGFTIQWSSDKGFGELSVWMRPDGTIRIDNEGDSRSALLELFAGLLNQGTLVDEPDPSEHH